MKSFQILFAFFFLLTGAVTAQTKTSSFKVWGNCGMCKKTIEGAAKNSGASFANWDTESKMLTVKYASSKTSVDKIQKGIADAGYDNVKYDGSNEAYANLHECCKYDRKSGTSAVTTGEKEACCVKDGKCTGTMDCCKKVAGKSDCCTTGACAKEGGCCADMKCDKNGDCCKKPGMAANCCKEGKCEKGGDCCKDEQKCKEAGCCKS
jgi:periplasmic mercuric ion binding protein